MNSSIVPYDDSNRQPQVFNFNGNDVRTVLDDNGDPVFVALDVCRILEIANERNAYSRLDDDEKDVRTIDTLGGPQQMVVVSESGLYSLVLSSRKPEAKAFKRWITHDVLPALRKNGSYSLQQMSPLQQLKAMVAHMEQTERQIAELHQIQAGQAQQIEAINDELLDRDYYTIRQWCKKQRIDFTPALLSMWGKTATGLSRERGIERKEASEGLTTVGRYHKSILLDTCVAKPKNTGQLPLMDAGGR